MSVPTLLDPNEVIDPPNVRKVLEQGWRKHIPLSLLTNARCRSSLFAADSAVDTLILGNSSTLELRQPSLDATGETSISFSDFAEAWPRLCGMIEQYLASPHRAVIAATFKKHYEFIASRNNFAAKFKLFILYDIHIHQSYIQNSS